MMAHLRPQRVIVLEGDVNVEGRWHVIRTPGRMVLQQINGYWSCHLEQFVYGAANEQYILTSREIKSLPSKLVELASKGLIRFYHDLAKVYVQCWCNKRTKDLEDAAIVILAAYYDRSFEEQKVISGHVVHEVFLKNASRTDSNVIMNYPKIKPARGRVNDLCYWKNSRLPYGSRVPEHQNGQNFRSRNPTGNSVGYRRNSFNGNQNSENQSKVGSHWTNRDQHHGRGRNWRERTSGGDYSSAKESIGRQQLRCHERTGRSQQPLRDRGSAENSLDRSEEKRDVSRGSSARDDNAGKPESTRGLKPCSSVAKIGEGNQRPEQIVIQPESPIRVDSTQNSPKSPVIGTMAGDKEENERRFSSTPKISPVYQFAKIDKTEATRAVTGQVSPRTTVTENAGDGGPFANRNPRFYGSSTQPQLAIFHKSSVPQNNSFVKRNGHHLSLSPAKKAKFNVTFRREDKENDADCSRESHGSHLHAEIGFKNFGTTCYINTALQAIFKLDGFASDLLAAFARIKCSLKPNTVVNALWELLLATKQNNVFKRGLSFEKELKALQMAVKNEWKGFIVNEMQDSQEFLSRVLGSMSECFDGKLQDSLNPIKKNIAFDVVRKHTCVKCFHSTIKRESHFDVGISFTKRHSFASLRVKSLQRLLESSFKTEEIELQCNSCKEDRCKVEACLANIPRVLMLHLKRYKSLNGRQLKNDTPIRIPRYVTLKDLLSPDCNTELCDSNEVSDGIGNSRVEAISVPADAEPIATCENGDVDIDWNDVEPSEDEQLNKAISNSLLVDDPQEADEIAKAKELSLKEFSQQNVNGLLDDVEVEDIEEDTERENEDNFQTGHMPHSYRIATIIKHEGTVSAGHYTCLVSDLKQNFKVYDDEIVRNITEEDALEVAGQYGYVMLYVHKNFLKGPSG